MGGRKGFDKLEYLLPYKQLLNENFEKQNFNKLAKLYTAAGGNLNGIVMETFFQ